MKYVLKDLLWIRELREQRASENLIRAKNALELAAKKVKVKEKELADYRIWRTEEETRLFNQIINKKVKRTEVNELKYDLAVLKQKELEHEKAVKDAEEEREKAKAVVEAARQRYKKALMDLEKIKEHKVAWVSEWTKEQELIMDREMEEFPGMKMSVE